MKLKGLLLAGICAIGLQAQDFKVQPYKASIGLLGGYSINNAGSSSDAENAWIGGMNFKYETKIKHTNTYYGFGADFLQTSKFKADAVDSSGNPISGNIDMNSISIFGTIGQQFTKNISANLYAGPAYNKIEGKQKGVSNAKKDSEGKVGYMLGASLNYGSSGLIQELMLRHTASKFDEKVSSTGLFYRIGISF